MSILEIVRFYLFININILFILAVVYFIFLSVCLRAGL